jgi:hypothetical protein
MVKGHPPTTEKPYQEVGRRKGTRSPAFATGQASRRRRPALPRQGQFGDGARLYDGRNRAQNGWFVLRSSSRRARPKALCGISAWMWCRIDAAAHGATAGYPPDFPKGVELTRSLRHL